jgi:pantoate--beta-alanine ligase
MGYLHEGHLSLVRRASEENDATVVSIFVNPLQFGPREDFKRYPRNLERDKRLLKEARTDFLFLPRVQDLYRPGFQTSVSVKDLGKPLCGRTRPTHFSGVATVVLKLLNLVRPDTIYLGQKDFQQCRVIEQMVDDLEMPVEVKMVPIIRERDGLAMSSRNIFLSPTERREAPFLYQALKRCKKMALSGCRDGRTLKRALRASLNKLREGRVDYAEIVDALTLSPVVKSKPGREALAALAVFYKKARLIDNLLIKG